MECKNCGNTFEGKFCNNCGQKADTHRLTIKHYLHETLHTFTHLDTGIIYLIKELARRPGEVVREYVEGARKKYFNPMQFLILGVGVNFFLALTFHLMGPTEGGSVPGQPENIAVFFRQFNAFFYKFYNIMVFFGVPIYAFFSYLFFKSSKYNYAENLILNTFLTGERCLIFILFTPAFYFAKKYYFITLSAYIIAFSAYFIWGYIQFFRPKRKFTAGLKVTAIIFLHLILNQIISMAIFYFFFYKR
jgi:hypothetical protein